MAASATSRIEHLGETARVRDFENRISRTHTPHMNNSLDFIVEHPLRSLLVGLGLGLLISAVLMRR